MTPEQFLQRNPNWRDDAVHMVERTVAEFLRVTEIPLPWPNDVIDMIEEEASKMTIEIFAPLRDQMGDDIFSELVLLVGRETKRVCLAAREVPSRMLQ